MVSWVSVVEPVAVAALDLVLVQASVQVAVVKTVDQGGRAALAHADAYRAAGFPRG